MLEQKILQTIALGCAFCLGLLAFPVYGQSVAPSTAVPSETMPGSPSSAPQNNSPAAAPGSSPSKPMEATPETAPNAAIDSTQNVPPASATDSSSGLAVGAADNTRINSRDRDTNSPSASTASNKEPDRKIMQGIRKAVMADKSLSTYAHNIKIISADGKVTLKGPVRSETEKQSIEDKAEQIVGAGNVDNQLDVAAKGNKGNSIVP